ncbi:MAG TPA: PDZ domain-containing protein [Steroidobacteraceae bacterium]|nr:PDZ domain-containing protein [Steroidobacteraceae bacterium]
MSNKSRIFAPLTCAALLALAAGAGAAEQDSKSTDTDARSQAELERKLAEARKRLDEAAREVANLSMSMSDDMVPHIRKFVMNAPRAVLGINLGTKDEAQGGGVEVVSVSPGGAAERAGLKAGDVLTEINGKALKSQGDESAREQLLEAMRKVNPGDSVALSYRRDNKVVKANLVAQPLKDRFFTRALPAPEMGAIPRMPNFVFMRGEGVFGSAELVPMTPKLGQYFGTETGLLVVRAPDDSRLKLEDGDVIVDIDGRTPASPSHALRILSSYQAGEKLKLTILRTKKRMTFDITVPEDATWEKRLDGARLEHDLERGLRHAPIIRTLPGTPGIRVEGPGPFSVPAPPLHMPLPDEPV